MGFTRTLGKSNKEYRYALASLGPSSEFDSLVDTFRKEYEEEYSGEKLEKKARSSTAGGQSLAIAERAPTPAGQSWRR